MDQAPEQIHRAFQEAFNRHDLDALCALYEADAVLLTRDGPTRGLEAIREAYRRTLSIRPFIQVQTLGATQAGDLALLHGKWIFRGKAADGSEIRTEGRNAETVRRQRDGRWLFVIDDPLLPE